MATQLPNRLYYHGNRSELAFSRVTHLKASPIRQLCVFHATSFIYFVKGLSLSFCVFSFSLYINIIKGLDSPSATCVLRQLTHQDIMPAAYVGVIFCQLWLVHYKQTRSPAFKIMYL